MRRQWMQWGLMAIVGAAMVVATGCTDDPGGQSGQAACTSDQDCPEGYICDHEEGTCVVDTEDECADDADCPDGFVCEEGMCVIDEEDECVDDADCPDGYACEEGECVVDEEDECVDDADCPDGYVCEEGECVADDDWCASDEDCPPGFVCDEEEEVCVVDDEDGCTDDQDCPPGFVCDETDGSCIEDPEGDRRDGLPYDPECVFDDRATHFEPDELWSFQVDETMPYATYDGHGSDSAFEGHPMNQVMMTPVVIDLDNDGDEVPDVVFTTFATTQEEGEDENGDPLWDFLITGVLRAVNGDDGTLKWSVGYKELGPALGVGDDRPSVGFMPAGSIAAGDITNDGTNEVVAPIWDYDGVGPLGLAAVDHEGDILWVSDSIEPSEIEFWWGGPSIADLNGDGNAEIIIGPVVFDNQGNLLWDGRDTPGLVDQDATGSNFSLNNSSRIGPLSVVMDLDNNGYQEIITGRAVLGHNGNLDDFYVFWEATDLAPDGTELEEGYPAVADFSGDGISEVVVVSAGTVRIHHGHTGELLWGPVDIPNAGRLGPPTVADMTGDEELEIGVAGSDGYFVLAVDSSTFGDGVIADFSDVVVWWDDEVQDWSSNTTGSSVFDFNGDGTASIIYNDELYLRVFDGPTGEVLFEAENPSFTALENPVIADVNNDGAANIVVPASDFECGKWITECDPGRAGVHAFRDRDDNWVTTRRIWNQHSYSINHVEEDGTIPANPTPNYLDHNTFRLNMLTEIEPQAAPNLFPDDPDYLVEGESCTVLVDVWITNSGAIQVGPGIPVSLYAEGNGETHLITTGYTQQGLAPGEAERVSLDGMIPYSGTWDIVAIADDDDGESTRNECDTENNRLVIKEDFECM